MITRSTKNKGEKEMAKFINIQKMIQEDPHTKALEKKKKREQKEKSK